MKPSKRTILAIVALAVVVALVLLLTRQRYKIEPAYTASGLASLKCDGVDFLASSQLTVHEVWIRNAAGQTIAGATEGPTRYDEARHQLERTFPWGQVTVTYTASRDKFLVSIATTNTSATDTITGLWYQPLTLKFPVKVKEYDGSIPLLYPNVGGPAVSRLSYGSGALAVVSEDIQKPLMIGFPWSDNRPENTVFPLSVNIGRVKSYPDSLPYLNRPIPPKGTDEYQLSIRFGPVDETDAQFGADVYKRFSEVYPYRLNWPDRRAIGSIVLATAGEGSETNPRAWLNDPAINVKTPEGCQEFRRRMLSLADSSIAILRDMHAQGAITWDIEGQQYAHVNLVGDPRLVDQVAPEMSHVSDEFFARFRNAGFLVGVWISPDKSSAKQVDTDDPAQVLIDKIAYANKRWGASMFYLDSNVDPHDPNPIDAAIIQKVAAAFPNVLLIPQYSNLRYYAFSAPYKELRQGFAGTPELVRTTYPKAFSAIYTPDGLIDYYSKSLKSAVAGGDALVYRTWWRDPQNLKVKSLYGK